MTIRTSLLLPMLLIAAVGWQVTLSPAAEPARKPNVLFIIADDLNCDLGCYGHKVVKSPHIDRFAVSGVRFDHAYVQYTVCNPSRTSFLTGLRPTTTKVMDNATNFRSNLPDAITLPELFRKNGYYTVGLGKIFHRGHSPDDTKQEMDDPRSFDSAYYGQTTPLGKKGVGRNLTGGALTWCRWLAAEGDDSDQADGQLADEAVKLLSQQRGTPLFLAVGFYRPHDPFHAPKKYFDQYDKAAIAFPNSPEGYTPPYPISLGGGALQTAFAKFTDDDRREFLHAYYAGISFMDAQVGRLLDALDKHHLTENTIVVLVGDHGYELGVRDWWNKNTLFERSCRTPLIVRFPGAQGNGRGAATFVEFIDIYPTLAHACSLAEIPVNLEGTNFEKILHDPTAKHRDAALTVVQRGPILGRSIRTATYRYTEWDAEKNQCELYDHTADPGEWINLADKQELAPQRAALSALIRQIEKGSR